MYLLLLVKDGARRWDGGEVDFYFLHLRRKSLSREVKVWGRNSYTLSICVTLTHSLTLTHTHTHTVKPLMVAPDLLTGYTSLRRT
jgi:hypothetical protein